MSNNGDNILIYSMILQWERKKKVMILPSKHSLVLEFKKKIKKKDNVTCAKTKLESRGKREILNRTKK